MKFKRPLIALVATGIVATGVVAASAVAIAAHPVAAPSAAKGQAYWANVHWDDDDAHIYQKTSPLPLPNADALKQAGMVRVAEVERDDAFLEVEGFDAQGRELDIRMDVQGQKVVSAHYDD